jgi:Asp-tRNA(Asn)/Glu-tRNA(Gln) amidotransferase A subunit family amidase
MSRTVLDAARRLVLDRDAHHVADREDPDDVAALVRDREVSPRELVEAAARRNERRNLVLNAVIAPLLDEAVAAAGSGDLPRGPFTGVPLLLKDIGATQAGLPQYSGSRALLALGHRSPADTELGARFRRAGFIVAGLTNTSEFGSQPTTQPLAFGPTRNPWDPARSVAGSSGGAAAAVAAGMVAIAHGSDIAGSIRMPSSWCGTVGLKPSRGRVPIGPLIARDLVEHVITRTVRDTAAVAREPQHPSFSMNLRGRTDLALALRTAARELAGAGGAERRAIVLSDCRATAGDDPVAALGGLDRVDVLGTSQDPDAVAAGRRLARRGGGRFLPATRFAELQGALAEILS